MRAGVLFIALMGCGRVGFDATAERLTDAPNVVDTPADAFAVPVLLAYFPFDDDPTDGVDNRAIGAGLAACASTCPTLVAGVNGSAYKFNGTTDAIRYPDQVALHTQTGTVAMWIRIVQTPAFDKFMVPISKAFGSGVENTWEMFLYQDVTTLDFKGGGDSGVNDVYASTAWTTPVNTWVHVALTWGSKIRLYIGGVVKAEENDPGRTYDTGDIYIGSDFDNGTIDAHFNGVIDDVYLFSGELSPADIAMLATP